MSETNPVAMNVEKTPAEPASVTAIRDAIQALLPVDENIVSNVSLHDGLADISLRWRSLRFNVVEAIAGRGGDEIALMVEENFRKWLLKTVGNMKDQPKHGRVVAEMSRWLKANPDKRAWLYGPDAPVEEAVPVHP